MTGRPSTAPPADAATPAQMVFDLALRPAHGAGDFLVSACNAAAIALIDRWPDWPIPTALIVAPASAGKSHLAAVWRERSGAGIVAASAIGDDTVAHYRSLPAPALVVEDIDRGIADERVLFHLMNHAREAHGSLLVTSRAAPGELPVALPDLRSRLRALAPVMIEAPDDAVLGALIVKLFGDRQLDVEPAVVAYLLRHMERSFEAAARTVAAIDRLALARRSRVTRPLVAAALQSLGQADPD